MKISYIFRTQSLQRSIERVFEPIIENMKVEGYDVDVEFAELYSHVLVSLWKNMCYFRKVSKKNLCHITGDVQYVACLMNPKNTVLTIHDLAPLHNKNVPWYAKFLCYWLWYYIPLRRLKTVTCISEATRQDLISFFPWAKQKISVIPNPIDPAFHYVHKEFNMDCPTILHIGTKPNKNLLRVIEALDGLKCHLRIIGKLNDDYLAALDKHHIDFSNEFGISDEQIIKEYEQCDIVSFPSLFEGFGMPIIEAQTVGRVVVTSNIEPMKSVGGDSVQLSEPNDVCSIRESFEAVICNQQLREYIISAGLKNASMYSSKEISKLYNNIYKRYI